MDKLYFFKKNIEVGGVLLTKMKLGNVPLFLALGEKEIKFKGLFLNKVADRFLSGH